MKTRWGTKQAAVLAAIRAGAETPVEIEAHLPRSLGMTQHLISGHVSNLVMKGLVVKIGEAKFGRRACGRYAIRARAGGVACHEPKSRP